MKYFVISDIHGYFSLMQEALKKAGFDENDPDHWLISCGDLFDRGPENKKCLEWIMSLERVTLIRGNHEDLLEELLHGRYLGSHDISNGTYNTVLELSGHSDYQNAISLLYVDELLNGYLRRCVNYAEIGDNIFVHGWLPYDPDEEFYWRKASTREWQDYRWLNGMMCWFEGDFPPGKTVWCGHFHVTWGRAHVDHAYNGEWPRSEADVKNFDWSAWKKPGIVALDACTALSGVVNVEVFEHCGKE